MVNRQRLVILSIRDNGRMINTAVLVEVGEDNRPIYSAQRRYSELLGKGDRIILGG